MIHSNSHMMSISKASVQYWVLNFEFLEYSIQQVQEGQVRKCKVYSRCWLGIFRHVVWDVKKAGVQHIQRGTLLLHYWYHLGACSTTDKNRLDCITLYAGIAMPDNTHLWRNTVTERDHAAVWFELPTLKLLWRWALVTQICFLGEPAEVSEQQSGTCPFRLIKDQTGCCTLDHL